MTKMTGEKSTTVFEVIYITMIGIIGLSGNITQLFVYLSKSRNKGPTGYNQVRFQKTFAPLRGFTVYLAINDSVLLVNSWILFAMHRVFSIPPKNLFYVPYVFGINHYCMAAHIWGTVALTIDRCLAICCPLWNKTKKPTVFVRILLMTSSFLSAIYALPTFFEISLQKQGSIEPNITYKIARYPYAQHLHANASQLYLIGYKIVAKTVLTTCVPVVCLLICTILMIYTLKKLFKIRKQSNVLVRMQLHAATNMHVDTLNQVLSVSDQEFNYPKAASSLQIPACRRKSRPLARLRSTQPITNQVSPRRTYLPLLVVLVKAITCYSMPLILNIIEYSGIDNGILRTLSVISNCLVITEASSNFYIYIAMSEQYREYVRSAFFPKAFKNTKYKSDKSKQRRITPRIRKLTGTQNGIEQRRMVPPRKTNHTATTVQTSYPNLCSNC